MGNNFFEKSFDFCSSLSNEEREVFHSLVHRLATASSGDYSMKDVISDEAWNISIETDISFLGKTRKEYHDSEIIRITNLVNESKMTSWILAEVVHKLYNLDSIKQEKLDRILGYLETVSLDESMDHIHTRILKMMN